MSAQQRLLEEIQGGIRLKKKSRQAEERTKVSEENVDLLERLDIPRDHAVEWLGDPLVVRLLSRGWTAYDALIMTPEEQIKNGSKDPFAFLSKEEFDARLANKGRRFVADPTAARCVETFNAPVGEPVFLTTEECEKDMEGQQFDTAVQEFLGDVVDSISRSRLDAAYARLKRAEDNASSFDATLKNPERVRTFVTGQVETLREADWREFAEKQKRGGGPVITESEWQNRNPLQKYVDTFYNSLLERFTQRVQDNLDTVRRTRDDISDLGSQQEENNGQVADLFRTALSQKFDDDPDAFIRWLATAKKEIADDYGDERGELRGLKMKPLLRFLRDELGAPATADQDEIARLRAELKKKSGPLLENMSQHVVEALKEEQYDRRLERLERQVRDMETTGGGDAEAIKEETIRMEQEYRDHLEEITREFEKRGDMGVLMDLLRNKGKLSEMIGVGKQQTLSLPSADYLAGEIAATPEFKKEVLKLVRRR